MKDGYLPLGMQSLGNFPNLIDDDRLPMIFRKPMRRKSYPIILNSLTGWFYVAKNPKADIFYEKPMILLPLSD